MALQKTDNNFIYHKIGGNEVIFEISDEDESGNPLYYGYLSENGSWIIQQHNTTTGAYRYKMGQSDYATNWTGRGGLSYVYYNAL